MLTLTFLGVGGAFAKRNYQSNALVEAWSQGPDQQDAPDDTLLIDFGTTGPLALHDLKDRPGFGYLARDGRVYYPRIHRIFITHQHADHIGGLEELALMNRFIFTDGPTGKGYKAQIISTMNILVNLWDNSLKGGLNILPNRHALLQDYFFILGLRPGDPEHDHFDMLRRYRVEPFATDHMHIDRKFDWPSNGLTFTDRQTGRSAVFSGDTRFDPETILPRMQQAGICFHEVQLDDRPNPVHALLSELRTLPAEVRRKTYLYHYDDHYDNGDYNCVDEEFAGFARPQQRYVLFD